MLLRLLPGVAVSNVCSAADIVADPHYLAREDIVTGSCTVTGPIKQVGIILKRSRTPGQIGAPAPAKGEHNAEVYGGWLGLTAAQIAELERCGVI